MDLVKRKNGNVSKGNTDLNDKDDEDNGIINDINEGEESSYRDIPVPSPPDNPVLCIKKTNRPPGCPCQFGNECISGNCDPEKNYCQYRDNDVNTMDKNIQVAGRVADYREIKDVYGDKTDYYHSKDYYVVEDDNKNDNSAEWWDTGTKSLIRSRYRRVAMDDRN